MAFHGRYTASKVSGVSVGYGLPSLSANCRLHWYPVLSRVCVFPIHEECDYEEKRFAKWHPHRPLFYSEIDSMRLQVLTRREGIRRMRHL